MKYKLFSVDNDGDCQYLHGVIDYCIEHNYSDAEIIKLLQDRYDPSCWFSVISFTEEVIYGLASKVAVGHTE